jgi:hypothetical protein
MEVACTTINAFFFTSGALVCPVIVAAPFRLLTYLERELIGRETFSNVRLLIVSEERFVHSAEPEKLRSYGEKKYIESEKERRE